MEEETKAVGAELIEKGLQVIKLENESQMQMAIQRPRDINKVFNSAIQELKLAPKHAQKAWYSIPYENKDTGQKTFVEGPSIKAAMALARNWTNCTNGARVVNILEDRVVVEGVFLDYESNFRTLRQVSVPKQMWSRQLRKVVPLREDRLNIAIQSGMSKAVRNAILASIPDPIKDQYIEVAKEISGIPKLTKKTDAIEKRIDDAKKKFIAIGVTEEQFNNYCIDNPATSNKELLENLIGVYNTIQDGVKSKDDIFGETPEKPIEGPVKEKELFNE